MEISSAMRKVEGAGVFRTLRADGGGCLAGVLEGTGRDWMKGRLESDFEGGNVEDDANKRLGSINFNEIPIIPVLITHLSLLLSLYLSLHHPLQIVYPKHSDPSLQSWPPIQPFRPSWPIAVSHSLQPLKVFSTVDCSHRPQHQD